MSERLSGYVIVDEVDEEDPNKAPRNGIPDMDRSGTGRRGAKDAVDGAPGRVKLEKVWKIAEMKGLNRMGGMELYKGPKLDEHKRTIVFYGRVSKMKGSAVT